YRHSWRVGATALALPVTALIGWALLIWRAWKMGVDGRDLLGRTLAVALPAVAALALLFWQMRAAPAAQMMALPAATAIVALLARAWLNAPQMWKHLAVVPLVLFSFGAVVPLALQIAPKDKASPVRAKVAQANRRCPSLAALAPINAQPRGTVFTFIDLGPRLIVATHHDAIGGPYHRNDQAIADVMKAFRGDEAQARRIISEYRSDYLLICPNMSTATIFMSEAPGGFYGQLVRGNVPGWLEPVALPKDSPFKMWKVKG
ncbi:MAG TPA: AcrB/AcrD/AcrF family protein, partial [Sphingomicrobium sp.]|nr:AcrB/AcrD/AcrF family protein [Sphingomicrobium sp.]